MRVIICKNGERVLVDDDKYEILSRWTWRVNAGGYAYTSTRQHETPWPRVVLMHQCIVGQSLYKLVTDHINWNKLDNRRENLRHICVRDNALNSPRFSSKPIACGPQERVWADRQHTYPDPIELPEEPMTPERWKEWAAGVEKMSEAMG